MFNEDKLVQLRRQFHQIPELGFEEVKTQRLVLETIAEMNQQFIEVRTWKTGVFVRVKGKSDYTVAYRSDMDGLPLVEATNLPFESNHSGKMHACGHDLHMTIALGILAAFSEVQPSCTLLFIFQPAEEGPGGAEPILVEKALGDWYPDEIYALHIDPNLPVGTIATKPGLLFANTSELFIDLKGRGGHAAYPHTANDMVVSAAHLVTQLQTLVARNINPLDSAVVTIGVITGGTKQNVIAENARIEGTIRTLSVESMALVKQRIEALVKGIETGFACDATIDYGSNYCEVNNDQRLTEELKAYSLASEHVSFVDAEVAMTGEDFGYFQKEIPGVMFWLGVDSAYGLHHPQLNPQEGAISIAVNFMTEFLLSKNP